MTKEISIVDQTKKMIMNSEAAFKAVLPENFNVQKFIATFCLEVQKNPKLAQCTNLIEVARDVASFGLVIGGLANQAYLIPFDKKKKVGNNWETTTNAQLIIGYRGYITKLEEAGYTVEAEVVTEEEVEKGCFQEIRGSESKIIHNPIRRGIRTRENIALAYCIIKGNNTPPVISVLSKEEIEEIGKTSQWVDGKKEIRLSNVWLNADRTTDFAQQCIKTVIRNAVKKVNLRIANEMSTYEGLQEQETIDVTPKSKTAHAHALPSTIENSFKTPELRQVDIEEVVAEASDSDNSTVNAPLSNQDRSKEIFDEITKNVEMITTARGINAYMNGAADKMAYLDANNEDLKGQIVSLVSKRLEEVK